MKLVKPRVRPEEEDLRRESGEERIQTSAAALRVGALLCPGEKKANVGKVMQLKEGLRYGSMLAL